MEISEVELARRKDYFGLGQREAVLLRALLPALEAAGPQFRQRLTAQLDRIGEAREASARAVLTHADLAAAGTDPLGRLLAGPYDLDYARHRIRDGETVHQAGIKPEWLVGSYRFLLEELLPAARAASAGDLDTYQATVSALFKAMLLDIELAVSAYFHADHEKLRLFAKVFESDLEAVLIVDRHAGIVHASHMTQSISGYTPQELRGHSAAMLLSPRNRLSFDDIWQEVVLDGDWHGNVWHRHANGADYLARMSIAAVKNESGEATHYVIEYSDTTEAWEAEKALTARTEELARSNRELEQFAYVASHDLQEPLRMVASYTQLLARRYKGKLDADADEFIGYAVDGATRMQALINDLLKLSRVGTRGKAFVEVDGGKLVDAALANLAIALRESGAKVSRDATPTLFGDDTQLIQLFQNLIGNALKFSRPGVAPEIHVGAKRIGRAWELSVRDNGIGIAPEYFERIFIIFQRLHSKAEYPGTGIGLSLCKKIVERHGGRIWVESRPGEGACFFFTIPDREVATDGA